MDPKDFLGTLPEVFVSETAMSTAVSRGLRGGLLRKIGPKVYTRNLIDPPDRIVQRHLWQLVAKLVPGALIVDRTALDCRPAEDGSVFVISDRKRDIELPGLVIRPRKGPPPLASDPSYIGGLFLSSEVRAFLDNMAPSRQHDARVRRTFRRDELELRLEAKARSHGPEALKKIRDDARQLAPQIDREAELLELDRMLSALLGTHDAPLLTDRGRKRQAGTPYDPDRLGLFEALAKELRSRAPVIRLVRDRDNEARTTLAFFEAYFSNFIEGTQFAVEEAADIVFHNIIPRHRHEDAHDVAETWRVVSDPTEMSRVPATPAALLTLLKQRHATVMRVRPQKHPGVFKTATNRAGNTEFVAPDLVEGTLMQAFDLYRGLDTPFARAVFMKFLIAEVHPFTDGNGRTARIMMNAELVSAGEERIVIPTVFRDNYITALRALSRGNPRPLVSTLDFAQRWVAAVPWAGLGATTAVLTRCNAFLDASEAEKAGIVLRTPDEAREAEPGA